MVGNYENIKGKGFESRSTNELREIQSRGGKKSGETRRKKADFRKCLNTLLTSQIYNNELTPMLQEMGLDSTAETAVNLAMIIEALNGSEKAYEVIAKYSGQNVKTETDQKEQELRMTATKAKMGVEEDETEDDGFMDALSGSSAQDWNEDNEDKEEADL